MASLDSTRAALITAYEALRSAVADGELYDVLITARVAVNEAMIMVRRAIEHNAHRIAAQNLIQLGLLTRAEMNVWPIILQGEVVRETESLAALNSALITARGALNNALITVRVSLALETDRIAMQSALITARDALEWNADQISALPVKIDGIALND